MPRKTRAEAWRDVKAHLDSDPRMDWQVAFLIVLALSVWAVCE